MDSDDLWFVDYSITTGGDTFNKTHHFLGKFYELSRRLSSTGIQVHEIKYLGKCELLDSAVEGIGRMWENRDKEA